MSDAEHRDIAEVLFEPKQNREEIKDAIKGDRALGVLAPLLNPTDIDTRGNGIREGHRPRIHE